MCRLGCTPSWITRVRNSPGVFFVTTRSKINCTRSGPPQVQIVTNDFFEELTPAQGAIEDLRQADFHLPNRQIPIVPGPPVSGRKGSGIRSSHLQNIRSMSSGPSESQMRCSFSGSAQERNPLSKAS